MYGVDQGFWLELIILITILGLIIFSFNAIMRTLLKVEKKKLFSNTHINEVHKKVDWSIRITIIVFIIFGFLYNLTRAPTEWVWYLEPWFLLCLLLVISESVTAYMEWKYETNRKNYIFTISQIIFFIILVVSVFSSNFFGLM
ncbi:DUF4181 domain-containing protein [Bacillus hwajinpoensis]|uniref:DUF4181 domain-containing protein n=1 Tax=Guptibacillus hwajinpoensis TaxID=208199 RepID=A0A845F406_9BACL|nr:DUF4181 domain-containing protein [Pseudalkalibacillus hwajinpoensis]MYL65474.1 DUF4181 domain-containing protein [Pseudalkalibacillus hwajinpoensis]